MADYISVTEFAQLAHKSPQAIYKQLNNRLNPYIKLVDNQRMLDIRALIEIYGIEVEQPIQPQLTTDSTKVSATTAAIEALQQQLIVKDQQLAEKDKQLASKDHQLEEKDRQIATLHRLLEQQNTLALGDKQAILQLTGDQEEPTSSPEEPPTATEEPNKTGFFDRVKQFFR